MQVLADADAGAGAIHSRLLSFVSGTPAAAGRQVVVA
jgi:hypothetical protein